VNHAHFVRPTIFADVRDVIFGSVLSILPHGNETDAIRVAKETMHGLASYFEWADPNQYARFRWNCAPARSI
jgi:aldehyde dehydrogenase (NAD+)